MKIFRVLSWLCAVLWGCRIFAVSPTDTLAINSISVVDTNLHFVATFPSGVDQAVLEMRPTLADQWQAVAFLKNVPADGGMTEFSIPKPALETAFFRLNVALLAATNATYSSDMQFVAVPSLGPDSVDATEAVFHFRGVIDGSDRIIIRRQGALWEHVNWGWPEGAVTVNGVQWNPSEINYMTTTGAVLFLPQRYSLESPKLEVVRGRDVVALERTNDALIVYMDDTPLGAAPYEFKIHFPLATAKIKLVHLSPVATLKIAAVIDGSDVLKITGAAATWTHRAWDFPTAVKLNDIAWDVWQTNELSNTGTNRFLPDGVDFSTAKIINRQGRDVATMWAEDNALWVNFADNPNGADAYELEISFGPRRQASD
jgi:hypothetical protein